MATARSYSNIAFIKYWGNQDEDLKIPVNGSLSMNLSGIETITTVILGEEHADDVLFINGEQKTGAELTRVSAALNAIRALAGSTQSAYIESQNNFPTGAGIASSASAFSALALAASTELELELDERNLSTLARLGSGSACRSIPDGFVEWHAGDNHESSYAESIAPPDHWDLVDCVALVSGYHKMVGSSAGHKLAPTSPLQENRISDSPRRMVSCKDAILSHDFETFADIVEHDTLIMHAVMMTSQPALMYWQPATLRIIDAVRGWRGEGFPCCFTIDAGPNVHVITEARLQDTIIGKLRALEGVYDVLTAPPGRGTHLINSI